MSFKTYLDKSGFVIDHSPRKPVQHPGSRGGKGYFTKRGVWEYGEPPEDRAAGIEAEAPPKETKTPVLELGDHIDHVKSRGYSIVDKTTGLSAEERRQTWQAVDDITSQVEKVLPQLDSVMSRQPLELIVESASQGNGVRGEHVRPLYKGDSNRIQINAEFPRTFVHELGHYLDSASAILHPSGTWDHRHVLSDMYNTPIFNTVAKIKTYPEYQQWISERPRNERPYWTRPSEIFARFFDTWANNQLGKTPSDSYEPFTPQEITEAGEILKQGLKKLDLIKSFLEKDYGQEPGWVEKLMKAMPAKFKPLPALRPIRPSFSLNHEHKEIKNPGSRGSTHWYRNKQGQVIYGDQPTPREENITPYINQKEVQHTSTLQEELTKEYVGTGNRGRGDKAKAYQAIAQKIKENHPLSVDQIYGVLRLFDPKVRGSGEQEARNKLRSMSEDALYQSLVKHWDDHWIGSVSKDPTCVANRLHAAKMFGINVWQTRPDYIPPEVWNYGQALLGDANWKAAADSVVSSMYEYTQEYLQKHNITDLPVSRGVRTVTDPAILKSISAQYSSGKTQAEGVVDGRLSPLSSFTLSPSVATKYSGLTTSAKDNANLIMVGSVPAKRVLSLWNTGFGYGDHSEAVILGGPSQLHWITSNSDQEALTKYVEKIQYHVEKSLAKYPVFYLDDTLENLEWLQPKTSVTKSLKELLAYGIEPLYIQEMFKSIPVAPQIPKAPESEAQIQTGIGSKGGKYFIDKYGKKHYGPYGVQPPKKIKATEQPYLHEQAPAPPPEPPKPKKTWKEELVQHSKNIGLLFKPSGSTTDFLLEYTKNHVEEVKQAYLDGSIDTLAIDISNAFEKLGYTSNDPSYTNPAQIKEDMLYGIPANERGEFRKILKYRAATNPESILNTALRTMGVGSIGAIPDTKLGEVIDKMLEAAQQALKRPLTQEEESQIYSKYTNYLDKRIQDFQNAAASTKAFTHTDIQIGAMPAGIPPSDPDKLKGTHADAEQKIRDAHPENKTREDWKRFVARSVGQKMINLGITPEMCDEFFRATNTTARMPGADPRVSAADALVNSWAVSADGNNALSLAVQRLTSEVFPGALKWDTKQPWNGDNGWKWAQTYIDNPVAKQVMTGFLYAQYENTQEYFKSLGIQELTIGRGCKTTHPTIVDQAQEASKQATRLGTDKWVTSGELQEDHYVTNPLSSWGWDHETNTNFAGGGGLPSSNQPGQSIVLGTRVPVSRILGGFFSGNGCENEHEVLLIGSEKPVDRMLWAAWKDTDYSTETETKVKVADALVKGEKPTTQNMNFITPEQQFTAELTDILKDIGTKDNWSKLSDADLLDKIQDNGSWGVAQSHIVMGSGKKGKISARDNTISNDKVLKIAHNLMDQGYGLTYKQLIDKNMAQIGHVWTEFYKQDEQADPGSFKENTADYLVSNFVQQGIIDQQDASDASEYLTQKVKEKIQSEKSTPLLKDKTPNKTVYNLTTKILKDIPSTVSDFAHTNNPVKLKNFIDKYLFPEVMKKLGLDEDDLHGDPDFKQSIEDALTDEINKIKPGKIPGG